MWVMPLWRCLLLALPLSAVLWAAIYGLVVLALDAAAR